MRRPRLGELLVAKGLITRDQLDAALAEQRRDGGQLGEILVGRGALGREDLDRSLAEQTRTLVFAVILLLGGVVGSGPLIWRAIAEQPAAVPAGAAPREAQMPCSKALLEAMAQGAEAAVAAAAPCPDARRQGGLAATIVERIHTVIGRVARPSGLDMSGVPVSTLGIRG